MRITFAVIYREEARTPGPLNAHDPSGPYNYFNPWWHPFYHRGDLHTMQSVTKTVTSVVIGIATARKDFPSLDTPVMEFFDAARVANLDDRKRRMIIRHLLTMTAGIDWNEDLPYADPSNASGVMEASFEYAERHLFSPLGIDRYDWKRSPTGLADTEGGLYLGNDRSSCLNSIS